MGSGGTVIEIDKDLCENTQTCEAVCPVEVFEIQDNQVLVVRPNDCTVCFKCVEMCPSGAINIEY